jgi:hypothetical protein
MPDSASTTLQWLRSSITLPSTPAKIPCFNLTEVPFAIRGWGCSKYQWASAAWILSISELGIMPACSVPSTRRTPGVFKTVSRFVEAKRMNTYPGNKGRCSVTV